MKKTTAFIFVISLIFGGLPAALADDSDIFGANIQPNVLIMLDSSGSMNETVFSNPYDPNTTYNTPLTYISTTVYRRFTGSRACSPSPAPCYKVYKNSVGEVPDADGSNPNAARDALNLYGFWSGSIGGSSVNLSVGNYRNYLACSSCTGPLVTKISIAKQVLTNLVNSTEGVRFGAMKFVNNGNQTNPPGSGGFIVDPSTNLPATIGATKTTIVNALNAVVASGWTPLGEFLYDGGQYYKGQSLINGSSYTTPIEYTCQPNFVILMSDGKQNGLLQVQAEATNRYTQDHYGTTSDGTQNVIVHTIGFAIGPSEPASAIDDLQEAAQNGGGSFYIANNAAQLEQALEDAIQQILAATFSFATPVVPTTGAAGGNRAYLAAFQSNPSKPFWKGFLKAYDRVNGQIPVDPVTGLPNGPVAWDAGQMLSVKPSSSRTIYTVVGGVRQDFNKTNSFITTAMLGASSSTERDKIIDFTRGIDSYDEDADPSTTERAWKLGDIFHSTPALVGPPFLSSLDTTYTSFKDTYIKRTTALIVGANDGTVHAFRESDGEELWALIPEDLLGRLKDLTASSGEHGYYMDSSPVAVDICLSSTTDGTGNCRYATDWKTIVLVGERRGGKSYHALDITDINNPLYLWSFTDSKMGETWSEPAIGKIKMADGTAKFVAFVGGGYDTTQNNNTGRAFFAIDLATGTKLWEYYDNGSTDDRQYMDYSLAASPTAVDTNRDGFIDGVHIGDVGGQLWKFDTAPTGGAVLSGGLVANWTGKRLFDANQAEASPPAGEYYPAQAVYAPPVLSYDTAGSLWVFFGTGDRNHPNNTTAPNRLYGIKDNTGMTNGSALTESSLTDLTSGTGTVTQGWFIRLGSKEKVLASADVFNKIVLYTTFTPTSVVSCGSGGGDAKLYAVNMTAGDAALNLSTGQPASPGQSASALAKAIGSGIPSKPIIIINPSGNQGNPSVITGTTNQQIFSTPMPQVTLKRLVGWREVF